ncbi:MAG: hypothetical protein CSA60_01610 [Neptuniibacter caesariensis]|uniref:diguanylate cyclase n=1 Tax=Neptuniibacter caesariensis TaxID=207954 RepID=A0A2G6JRQ0_NEPCE|nr:MAG: hypothetical protein CSA60_01610 [Neptuniibacter caesariensis]
MSDGSIDWKNKYRVLSQEFETFERRSLDTEQQLRHLVEHLSLALEGESPELDAELASLRPLLQGRCSEHLSFLKKISCSIEIQARNLDDRRVKYAKETASALLKWIRMLRTQVQNSGFQNSLDSLERRSNDVEEKNHGVPTLLRELIELQSHIDTDIETEAALPDGDFSLDAAASNASLEGKVDILLKKIGAELLELISGLYVPKAESPKARELVKRIEQGCDLPHLPEILHQVVKLVIKSTSNASEDFENYLLELSSRLAEVQTFVVDSRQQQEVGQNQRDLDLQVRRNVKALHQVVKNAHDIGDLKKAVSLQLSGLVKAMDSFKKKEAEREQRLQGRYEDLIEKVRQMETETRQVKAHIDEERLRARTDPLTGLPNRAAYDEQAAQEYARWSRYKSVFSIVVADLDFFKEVNDTYGHLAGDKVLRLVAKVITGNIRTTDFVARYGGEEFVMLLPSTAADEALRAMDKVRKSLADSPFNFHGKPVSITMSFGVTEIKKGDFLDDAFARADAALYQAKEDGRNLVRIK